MKNYNLIAVAILLLFFVPNIALAQQENQLVIGISKSTAVANGTDTVTILPTWNYYGMGLMPSFLKLKIVNNNSVIKEWQRLEAGKVSIQGPDPVLYHYDYQTATFGSIKTGIHDIYVAECLDPELGDPSFFACSYTKKLTVTFTAPVTTPAATTTTTKNQTTTQSQKPTTPTLTELKINQNQYQNTNQYSYENGNAVRFSGKTLANAKITLTFNSEPFTDTTTSDANGNWVYELTKNLGEGEHTMTYAVTDPATNLTSDPSEAVKFTLVAAAKTEESNISDSDKDAQSNYIWWYVGGGIIVVALLSLLGFLIWKKKKTNKKEHNTPDTEVGQS